MSTLRKKEPDFSAYKKAPIIGPGIWFDNHLKSFKIIDPEDITSLRKDIERLQLYFPCDVCRKHLNDFCSKRPPKNAEQADIKSMESGIRPENLAKWLVDAHNSANYHKAVANKMQFRPNEIKYEDVREFFDTLGQSPCEGDCDKETPAIPVASVKITTSQHVEEDGEDVSKYNWKKHHTGILKNPSTKSFTIRIVPSVK